MRVKENADDYRYFPDPDLPWIETTDEEIARIKSTLPKLPDERRSDYVALGLSEKDAEQLISDPDLYEFFDKAAELTEYPKLLANLTLGELLSLTDGDIKAEPGALAKVADLAGEGTINSSTAKKLVRALCEASDAGKVFDPVRYVEENKLAQIRDEALLRGYVIEALEADPKAVAAYRAGKSNAAKAIMGKIMAKTGGRGDPVILDRLLYEELSK